MPTESPYSSASDNADEQYRNKTVINQRGATVEINNSTGREELKLSQYSGSNITLTNVANVELATNNKQTKVNNDSFESVGKDKNTFVGKDRIDRVIENSYNLRGFNDNTEIIALSSWKEEMVNSEIPGLFGQFINLRGGYAVPPVIKEDGTTVSDTEEDGSRASNSTLNQQKNVLENFFSSYCPVPIRSSVLDEVTSYEPVTGPKLLPPAKLKGPTSNDIWYGSGPGVTGSQAPGVVDYGSDLNGATEGGNWALNEDRTNEELQEKLKELQQKKLNEIEQKIGNGGDEISFIKRNKFETIGGAINNYPSIRVDPRGRSQPIEVAVGDTTSYTDVDFVPHVEEVNNDMNFPVGDYTLNVGNRYNVIVGSGGVQMKTTGPVEIGGTAVKMAGNKVNITASDGMHLHSPNLIELNSDKSISLRSKRQIYIEPGLGIKGDIVIGGGAYVEGELYVQHITAPVEIQQTEDTTLLGKFNCKCDRELPIGEALVGGVYYPVYALASHDLILNYPHSHHFKNIPLRMMDSNKDVRVRAQCEGINRHDVITSAIGQHHERKPILTHEEEDQSVLTSEPGGSGRCTPVAKEMDCPEEQTVYAPEDCDVRFSDFVDPNSSSGNATLSDVQLPAGNAAIQEGQSPTEGFNAHEDVDK